MQFIIFMITFLAGISANVIADRLGRKPNYKLMAIFRGMFTIVHWGLILRPDPKNWMLCLVTFLFYPTAFWILFEVGLNFARKDLKHLSFFSRLLYFDTTENDSGSIDRFFAARPRWQHTTAKIMAACIASFAGVVLFYNYF